MRMCQDWARVRRSFLPLSLLGSILGQAKADSRLFRPPLKQDLFPKWEKAAKRKNESAFSFIWQNVIETELQSTSEQLLNARHTRKTKCYTGASSHAEKAVFDESEQAENNQL